MSSHSDRVNSSSALLTVSVSMEAESQEVMLAQFLELTIPP